MKLNAVVFCCMTVLFIVPSGGVCADESIELAHEGASAYGIVLSEDASPSERYAASELRQFIKQISGADLSIVTESAELPGRMIVLGAGRALDSLGTNIDLTTLGEEGFAIRTVGHHLVIAGSRQRGTMYGVFAFLEDVLGCRWYTPQVSYIPRRPTIVLDSLDIRSKPAFEYRDVYFKSDGADARDPDWAARNRCNGVTPELDESHGGHITYGQFVHTFDLLIPPDQYASTHPEYFALWNGERIGGKRGAQLCLTNPDVLRIATREVLRWIEDNPKARIFSVSQNDQGPGGDGYCQCEDCSAVAEREGSQAGSILQFVNAIADEVAKKHPGVLIDTLAYNYSQSPPMHVRPQPNVRVRLCPSPCQYHPYNQCTMPETQKVMGDLRGWAKITNNLYIWHYTGAYSHLPMPFPDIAQLASSLSMYQSHGVVGVFIEGNDWPGNGGFMDELKIYMLAKLLWNPSRNADAVIDDFLNGYFGPSGKAVRQWLDLMNAEIAGQPDIHGTCWPELDYIRDTGRQPGGPFAHMALLTPELVSQSKRILDEAARLADTDEHQRRVAHVRMSLDYLTMMREVQSAYKSNSAETRLQALKVWEQLLDRLSADGVTYLGLDVSVVDRDQAVRKALGMQAVAPTGDHP
ncbi:MAG: DUF4838 domain-containing protein [Phycisphaerales bacterium]|jgi:hypothetical protein|nr:DUF4838 domain-containing protein [Phycisphaerales bacterium]